MNTCSHGTRLHSNALLISTKGHFYHMNNSKHMATHTIQYWTACNIVQCMMAVNLLICIRRLDVVPAGLLNDILSVRVIQVVCISHVAKNRSVRMRIPPQLIPSLTCPSACTPASTAVTAGSCACGAIFCSLRFTASTLPATLLRSSPAGMLPPAADVAPGGIPCGRRMVHEMTSSRKNRARWWIRS